MRLFYSLNDYLKDRFGEKVFKISIDGGFTCPNRDGTKGVGGCVYCNNSSFSFNAGSSISNQVRHGVERLSKRGIKKYIIYFQSYSNTYCSLEEFKEKITSALVSDDIIGLHIGTRPDVVDRYKLEFLSSLSDKLDIFLEYGLQSYKDSTLELINRGHTSEDFNNAYLLTKEFNLKVCAHVIFGLPYEKYEDMIDTVRYLSSIKIDSVKFHQLHVVQDTVLADWYIDNRFSLINECDYIKTVADSLALLHKDTIIARLVGDAPEDMLISPKWSSKNKFIEDLKSYMNLNGLFQGKLYI